MKMLINAKTINLATTMFLMATVATVAVSIVSAQKKIELPKGNWSFSAHPYMGADLEYRPVIVTSVETTVDKGLRLARVAILNRSTKPVTAIKLKWEMSYERARDVDLKNGVTDWFDDLPKSIPAGKTVTLRFVGKSLSFASMGDALQKDGILNGEFRFSIAVSEARYEDDTSWIAKRLIGHSFLINASSMTYRLPQTGCAKQKCKNLGGAGYTCEGSADSEYCTNKQSSCTATLCGEKPGGGDEFEIVFSGGDY